MKPDNQNPNILEFIMESPHLRKLPIRDAELPGISLAYAGNVVQDLVQNL